MPKIPELSKSGLALAEFVFDGLSARLIPASVVEVQPLASSDVIEMMIEGENQQHVVVAMTPAAALELAQMLRQAVQTSLENGAG